MPWDSEQPEVWSFLRSSDARNPPRLPRRCSIHATSTERELPGSGDPAGPGARQGAVRSGVQGLLLGSVQAGGEPAGEGGDLLVRRHWVARPQLLLWDLHKTGNPGR